MTSVCPNIFKTLFTSVLREILRIFSKFFFHVISSDDTKVKTAGFMFLSVSVSWCRGTALTAMTMLSWFRYHGCAPAAKVECDLFSRGR